ncbi:MAG: hypothetical protein ACOYLE_05550 [Bacteroidales bacterium]
MKKYNINIHSNRIAIISLIILFPLSLFIVDFITIGVNFTLHIIVFFGLIIGAGYLATYLSKSKIRIELTEESFKHIWVKRFIFSKEPDIKLDWNEIDNYFFENDRGFDSFQLTLNENKRYKITRYNHFPQHDDFYKFSIQFPKFINKVNTTENKSIKIGKTIFEEPLIKLFMFLATIVAVFILFYNLLYERNNTKWSSIGIMISGIIFYWMQVIRYRKKKQS